MTKYHHRSGTTTISIRQVKPRKLWPSGDSRRVAVLRFSPAELSRRYHLRFTEYADDLDAFQLAAIELDNGEQVWLQRYVHDPERGTVVLADSHTDLV